MKYVLCKGYYGMGGNIAVVVCGMRLAVKTGRKLLVDWMDGVYSLDGDNLFDRLFNAPQNTFSRDLVRGKTVWPEFWAPYVERTRPYANNVPLTRVRTADAEEEGLDELERYDVLLVTRDDKYWHEAAHRKEMVGLAQFLTPVKALEQRIDGFAEEKLGDGAIAVHFRHGNGEPTVVPPDIEWFFEAVDHFRRERGGRRVFVCTDCRAVLDAFTERYGDDVVSTPKEYPPLGGGAMHAPKEAWDPLGRAQEAILDMWLISRCSFLVGSKSFFSGVAMKLNPDLARSNVKVWKPEFRSHKPEPGHVKVDEASGVGVLLVEHGYTLDGLYVEELEGGNQRLLYLYTELCELRNVSDIDVTSVGRKLSKLRLY